LLNGQHRRDSSRTPVLRRGPQMPAILSEVHAVACSTWFGRF
jgi:hypothetical protein